MTEETKGYSVPLTDEKNKPIIIGVQFNEPMSKYDVTIDIGNFATREEAKAAADEVATLIEEHSSFTLQKVH